MKVFLTALIFISLIVLSGCYKSPTEPDQAIATVTGKITLDGQPVEGVVVNIDSSSKLRAVTNASGVFVINKLVRGEHLLSASKEMDGAKVIYQHSKIYLTEESTDLGEFNFIRASNLFEIDQNQITETTIPLRWTRNDAAAFVEYRVYRSGTPDVHIGNADLVFSSNNRADTSFVDKSFRTGQDNFYRVFSIGAGSTYSGSNNVKLFLPEVNLLPNGGFEESNGTLPKYWLQRLAGNPNFQYFTIDNSTKQDGNNSMRVFYDSQLDNPDPQWGSWGGIYQQILTHNWIAGKEYTLSFWVKADVGSFQVRVMKNGTFDSNARVSFVDEVIAENPAWVEKQINFSIDAETSKVELWISTGPGLANNGKITGWIDNIKIIK